MRRCFEGHPNIGHRRRAGDKLQMIRRRRARRSRRRRWRPTWDSVGATEQLSTRKLRLAHRMFGVEAKEGLHVETSYRVPSSLSLSRRGRLEAKEGTSNRWEGRKELWGNVFVY